MRKRGGSKEIYTIVFLPSLSEVFFCKEQRPFFKNFLRFFFSDKDYKFCGRRDTKKTFMKTSQKELGFFFFDAVLIRIVRQRVQLPRLHLILASHFLCVKVIPLPPLPLSV